LSNAIEEILEIETKEWKEHSNSFTIEEGGIIPKLDTLIKEAVIILLLILKQEEEEEEGKTITEIRNARILASHSLNYNLQSRPLLRDLLFSIENSNMRNLVARLVNILNLCCPSFFR
jgi:hypothetical protein